MSATTVSPIATLGSRVIQNANLKIDKSVCALTEAEEKELLSTRDVQCKREIVNLGKARANSVKLVNDYFDAPIENILQELEKQGTNIAKENLENNNLATSEEAIYYCNSVYHVNRFTLAAAYATIRDYTDVDDSQEGRYFCTPDETSLNLDQLVFKDSNYNAAFSTAVKAIDSFREVNDRTLAEVLE